jgi:crotonobetainyl-CoA:carnitine CoA-transferase CaiB-like acyl-CoA transferase
METIRDIGYPLVGDDGTVFMSVNKNKRGIVVDLKTAEGVTLVRRLVANSDVVVESFRTGVVARLGIDYASLRKIRLNIVYAGHLGIRSRRSSGGPAGLRCQGSGIFRGAIDVLFA